MNYGKFFKINLSESVDGVTIYDYVDLPAYFGELKTISPKYPINVVITKDAVRFRLHYCAYKYEDGQYAYDIVDNDNVTSAKTVHQDEVILELPFADSSMAPVSDVLAHIYGARFPLSVSSNSQENEDTDYLAQLLNNRYSLQETGGLVSEADKEMYQALRDNVDGDRSFSSIWLMGLKADCEKRSVSFNLKDSSGEYYIGFLRKLVLDFMFDLKHTDLFQNSTDYERMYSGLMSDFMFSSLMHKCEYYYTRGLIVDAIDKAARHGNPADEKKNIRLLYAPSLFASEKAWVDDIMNPAAERVFCDSSEISQDKNKSSRIKRALATVFAPIRLKSDVNDSWFNDPEEELRRVCFTMRGMNEERHLCNTETVAEYISIPDKTLVHAQRSRVSRWFLKRNAFVDAFHVHFPRFIDYMLPALIVLLAVVAVFCTDVWTKEFWSGRFYAVLNTVVALTGFMSVVSLILIHRRTRKGKTLPIAKVNLVGKRLLWWTLWVGVAACAILVLYKPELYNLPSHPFTILSIASILIFVSGPLWANVKIIPNVHLTYPRLIASIAAAWFTLAIGNELFISFFDIVPSSLACSLLSLIVFFFVLYDLNKDLPNAPSIVKFARSVGVLSVSLCLSLLVGLFVVNFVGERFLERSGNLGNVTRALESDGQGGAYMSTYGQTVSFEDSISESSELGQLSRLEGSRVRKADASKGTPVATVWTFANGYRLFILNGFLIQFAFLAMFIGVFIQMVFEEKSLNEL